MMKNNKVFIFDFDGTFYSGEHKYDNVKAKVDQNKRSFLKNINDLDYEIICKENPKWLDVYAGIDLINLLKKFELTTKAFRPIEEAIITAGGINVKEINPSTMESKIVSGLYFAGEIIDVDAYTGGFNLQIAFSTGYLAGMLQ